jgi:hypothetical protein
MPNGTPSPKPSQMYQREPTTRVCTVFFSALMGFALTRFFRFDNPMPEMIRWPCFTAALLLFLRFLFGSANHLWYELVRQDAEANANRRELFWHLRFLIALGILAVFICDSASVCEFLWRNALFGAVGITFNAITDGFAGGKWAKEWKLISGCHIVAVAALGVLLTWVWNPIPEMVAACALWALAFFFLWLLFWDLSHQLDLVESASPR